MAKSKKSIRRIRGINGGLVLAGDIGGTNARFRLYDLAGKTTVHEATLSSRSAKSLQALVGRYLGQVGARVRAAVLGIAGPVVDGVSRTTNLPWVVDERVLAAKLGIPVVRLVNDLAAVAMGCVRLGPAVRSTVWAGVPAKANCAVISAGTGLGEAMLIWDGKRYVPSATEGGHTDFGPRNPTEIDLLRYLVGPKGNGGGKGVPHVSYERVVSGPGLGSMYDFFVDKGGVKEPSPVAKKLAKGDRNAAICELGLSRKSRAAVKAVDAFAAALGAEAGNLALKGFALGGLYLCGRIAQEIVPRRKQVFLDAMHDKGRMRALVEKVPVIIVKDDLVGLVGAGYLAAQMAASSHAR
jgi:glucokinase